MRLTCSAFQVLLTLALIVTGVTGCTATSHAPVASPALAPHPPAAGLNTTLGPGDVFEVHVFGEANLSGAYRVSNDGSINFPLVGKLDLTDRSAGDAADLITEGLRGFLRDPYVSVFVTEFNSKKIYVIGQVKLPGTFRYEDGMSVIQAITLAGGFTPQANRTDATITRVANGQEERLKVSIKEIQEGRSSNIGLTPGDILYVPESIF